MDQRKIIQVIIDGNTIVVLCDDGTLWVQGNQRTFEWVRIDTSVVVKTKL
jgi:hypothetical protein